MVRPNVSLPHLGAISRLGVVDESTERRRVRDLIGHFDVTPATVDGRVALYSGGNQQKVLLSKWMFGAPRVVLLDEPSRGVDIGARRRIHDFVVELAAGGAAVLLVSSEIEEVIGLSHRAYLMSRGRIVGEVEPKATTVEDVLRLVLPKNARVVAGASGLAHRVTWASTVRPMYPMFERLEGGELILLSLAELRNVDDRLKLDYVAEKLSDAGVAALAVVGDVDGAATEVGEKLSLPIIRLPNDAHIHELERTIVSLVVNRRGELQSRAVAIYRRLTQVMLEGKGLAGIAEELSRITGRRTQLFDRSLRPAHGDRREGLVADGAETTILGTDRSMLSAMIANRPLITTSPPVVRLSTEGTDDVCYVAAIVVRRRIEGYLTLWGKIGELGELERLAIGRGADQVDGSVLHGKTQVILGLPVCPLDPLELDLGIDGSGQFLV
jgi:energy-coupling factor transporter ATP-binding protein EcfA2